VISLANVILEKLALVPPNEASEYVKAASNFVTKISSNRHDSNRDLRLYWRLHRFSLRGVSDALVELGYMEYLAEALLSDSDERLQAKGFEVNLISPLLDEYNRLRWPGSFMEYLQNQSVDSLLNKIKFQFLELGRDPATRTRASSAVRESKKVKVASSAVKPAAPVGRCGYELQHARPGTVVTCNGPRSNRESCLLVQGLRKGTVTPKASVLWQVRIANKTAATEPLMDSDFPRS
jgi:hypothetical protein